VLAAQTERAGYISSAVTSTGERLTVGLSLEGDALFSVPATAHSHGAAAHPNGLEIAVADRRYGQSVQILSRGTGEPLANLTPENGRSFQGHCTFLNSGKTLCATEADYGSGEGWISFWDADRGYLKIGETPSGGLGAEDVVALDDVNLLVSNTGLQTSPLTALEKRNLNTMTPNLTFMTPEGEITRQVTLPNTLQQQAIRHLDVSNSGQIAFSMTGEAGDTSTPYFGLQSADGPAQIIALPADPLVRGMSENARAVFSIDGAQVAIALPDRDRVYILETQTLRLLLSWHYEGVQGIAPRFGGGFLVSGADGRLYSLQTDSVTLIRQSQSAWTGLLTALF
jgi:hypothetical protein